MHLSSFISSSEHRAYSTRMSVINIILCNATSSTSPNSHLGHTTKNTAECLFLSFLLSLENQTPTRHKTRKPATIYEMRVIVVVPILVPLCWILLSVLPQLSYSFGVLSKPTTKEDETQQEEVQKEEVQKEEVQEEVQEGLVHQCDSNDIESIRDTLNDEGYIVLNDFFQDETKSLIESDWYNFSNNYWNRIFETMHSRGHISQPNHVMNDEYMVGKLRSPGYKEIVHRYPGRYELSLMKSNNTDTLNLQYDMPSLQPILDKLDPIVQSIIEQHPLYVAPGDGTTSSDDGKKNYNVIYSMLISAYGSHTQKFHIDTKHISDTDDTEGENEGDDQQQDSTTTGIQYNQHWPAHIFNVFIPLLNITTEDFGPTELIPKSHIGTRIMYNDKYPRSEKLVAQSQFDSPIAPLLNVGDVLIFDFRLLHRGLSNIDEREMNRPMLVLAYSIPTFQDTANWPGPSIFD